MPAEEKSSDKPGSRGDSTRGKPLQSKLRPFHDQIARWQREGMSLRKIAAELREQHGLAGLHHDTVHSFISVRARKNARSRRRLLPVESHPSGVNEPKHRMAPTLPPVTTGVRSRVVGADGKEIRNAQYAPVNPDEL